VTVSLEEDNSPDGYGWVTAVEMKDKTPDSVGVILYNTDTVDHAVIVHAIAVHD
jgi:hypothetical protein